jgi:Cu-Zn family superoxide dismutase
MKTKKNKKDKKLKKNIKQAVAILYPDKHYSKKNRVKGRIHFTQMGNRLTIKYKIQHLPKGYHGFHIHQFGDLTEGCKTAGPHFNTYKKNIHGGPKSKIKHNGDLGNIYNIKPTTSGTKIVSSKVLNLNKCNKNSIIGRSIIVHKDKDDLGKGNNLESLKTGNAGARLACGVIGISKYIY